MRSWRCISDNLWDITFKTCDRGYAGTNAYITVKVYGLFGEETSFGVDANPLPFDRGDTAIVHGKHFNSVTVPFNIELSSNGARRHPGWRPEWIRFFSRATVCLNYDCSKFMSCPLLLKSWICSYSMLQEQSYLINCYGTVDKQNPKLTCSNPDAPDSRAVPSYLACFP